METMQPVQMTFKFVNTGWNEKPIRRRVFRLRQEPLEDGTYVFKSKSFTRRRGYSYRCRVNPITGFVWCSCRDFKFRKGPFMPTYAGGEVCKHLRRAIRTVRQLGKEAAAPRAQAA